MSYLTEWRTLTPQQQRDFVKEFSYEMGVGTQWGRTLINRQVAAHERKVSIQNELRSKSDQEVEALAVSLCELTDFTLLQAQTYIQCLRDEDLT